MDIYEQIVQLRREGRRGAVATIVNVRGSVPSFRTAKMLVRDDGSIVGTIGGGCVEADVWQAAREVMESEKPRTLTFDLNQDPKYDTGLVCGGTLEVFVEPVLPPALLYVFVQVMWLLIFARLLRMPDLTLLSPTTGRPTPPKNDFLPLAKCMPWSSTKPS